MSDRIINQRNAPISKIGYRGKTATEYDRRRFSNPHGQYFDRMENREFNRVLARFSVPAKMLDVGCGTGRFSFRAAEKGHDVIAVDPSPDMITEAKKRCEPFSSVHYLEAEGTNLPLEDSRFDLVYSIRVTNQVASVDYAMRMIREMIRVTKPGGMVFVEFMNADRPRWLKRERKDVRLKHRSIRDMAEAEHCTIIEQRGILMGGVWLLKRIPTFLLPLWMGLEIATSRLLWRWTLRGYVLAKKTVGQ